MRKARALRGLLHTSLSSRSFSSCSREMTSTSARARGSRQMSSAGTWVCHRWTGTRKEPQEGDTKEGRKPEMPLKPTLPQDPRAQTTRRHFLTFSSRAFTSHSWRCFRLLYGLLSRPSKLGSAAPGGRREHRTVNRNLLQPKQAPGPQLSQGQAHSSFHPEVIHLRAPALPTHQGPACW